MIVHVDGLVSSHFHSQLLMDDFNNDFSALVAFVLHDVMHYLFTYLLPKCYFSCQSYLLSGYDLRSV